MKKQTNTEQNEPQIDTAFLSLLQLHRRGNALSDLSEQLRAVSAAVQLTGRAGSLTFKVTIKPVSKGTQGAMVVVDDIKSKVPQLEPPSSIFFADAEGNLHREDPNQMKLGLRVIDVSASGEQHAEPLRKVGGA